MNYKIDLNSDLGESFGNYDLKIDDKIIPLITSANVACGFHAGDPLVIMNTIKLAKDNNCGVGAHPGYPDLVGFGRRNMSLSPAEIKACISYQVSALYGMCKAQGLKLQHVKPHGALYNMSAANYDLAYAICEAVKEIDSDIIFMGLSGSFHIQAAKDLDMPVASEVFADRGYEKDGSLVARNKPGAFIYDEEEALKRVIRMIKEQKVQAVDGSDIDIKADSVCVHGDGIKALQFVQKIRQGLLEEGIKLAPIE